jgi:hypothetical protein
MSNRAPWEPACLPFDVPPKNSSSRRCPMKDLRNKAQDWILEIQRILEKLEILREEIKEVAKESTDPNTVGCLMFVVGTLAASFFGLYGLPDAIRILPEIQGGKEDAGLHPRTQTDPRQPHH